MRTIFHAADSRGHADHGWLNTYYSFSFGDYHNPQRIHFGCLRVLNDDTIEGGKGFGTHPHRDMEIITIPLEGDLEHKDSTGVTGVIKKGEIQVMSAGNGVTHSEYNHNADKQVKLIQIWVFSREKGVEPRAEQMKIKDNEKRNDFQQIISPYPEEEGLWIHQDAWFYLAKFDSGFSKEYRFNKKDNGAYAFVIDGSVKIGDQKLNQRDALGIWDAQEFSIEAKENSEVLIMEVPMDLP